VPVSTKTRRLRKLLLEAMGQRELGRRIRAARDDAGLTQSQLAARVGLQHPQSVSNYERGTQEVPPGRLRRIAEATGKPITYFVAEVMPPDVYAELATLRQEVQQLSAEQIGLRELAEEIKQLVSLPRRRVSR
jgi:transcriptional regulator with XRE-family HTH domain